MTWGWLRAFGTESVGSFDLDSAGNPAIADLASLFETFEEGVSEDVAPRSEYWRVLFGGDYHI